MNWVIGIPAAIFAHEYWAWPVWAAWLTVFVLVVLTPKCIDDWWDRQFERCRYPAISVLAVYAAYQFIGTLMIAPPTDVSRTHAWFMLGAVFLASWLYIGRPK